MMALLDLDAPDALASFRKPPTSVDNGNGPLPETDTASALHDLVLAEDKTWHSWVEFGDHVHRCTCGAPELHHHRLLALSKGN